MTIPEDFKTRLKIAKSKIKKEVQDLDEKKGSFMGNAFKLGTELVAAVAVGTIIGFIFCLLYTSQSPRDRTRSRMPSSA